MITKEELPVMVRVMIIRGWSANEGLRFMRFWRRGWRREKWLEVWRKEKEEIDRRKGVIK